MVIPQATPQALVAEPPSVPEPFLQVEPPVTSASSSSCSSSVHGVKKRRAIRNSRKPQGSSPKPNQLSYYTGEAKVLMEDTKSLMGHWVVHDSSFPIRDDAIDKAKVLLKDGPNQGICSYSITRVNLTFISGVIFSIGAIELV